MSAITLVAASVITVVFGWGGVGKLVRFSEWKEVLQAYEVAPVLLRPAAVLVPLAELTVVGLFLAGRARAGAALSLCLVAVFSPALIATSQRRGRQVPCGCFGKATPHDYRLLLARNAAIASLAGIILIYGHDRLTLLSAVDPTVTVLAVVIVVGLSLILTLARELQALRRQ